MWDRNPKVLRGFHPTRKKMTAMLAGKPCRPSSAPPPQAGLPSPFLAPFANKNYPEKKYTIQSAKASGKLIVAPIPGRGKAWAGEQQLVPGARMAWRLGRAGELGPAARLPTGENSFPCAAGAFGPGRYLGRVPGGGQRMRQGRQGAEETRWPERTTA